ncbi:MAG: hypothetical protein ACPHF3_15265, partial [Pseudomonadales bacterium]
SRRKGDWREETVPCYLRWQTRSRQLRGASARASPVPTKGLGLDRISSAIELAGLRLEPNARINCRK